MKKSTHKIYRTTNWPAYNRALINRGNIAIWFDPATQWYAPSKGKQGRNQTYSDAAIQCCLMIKSLLRLSLRMVTGFVQSLIKICGWAAPNISDIRTPRFVEDKSILIVLSTKKISDAPYCINILQDTDILKVLLNFNKNKYNKMIMLGICSTKPNLDLSAQNAMICQ